MPQCAMAGDAGGCICVIRQSIVHGDAAAAAAADSDESLLLNYRVMLFAADASALLTS